MIHARAVKPRIFPWGGDTDPEQIDRAQDIGGDLTLNREKLYEIGRDGLLGYKEGTPTFAYSMTQFEYGSINFWRRLANLDSGKVELSDLKAPRFEITAYLTDDDGSFRGTIWFPKLRTNGFTISVGDPEAHAERSFDLVGEDYKIITDNYFSFEKGAVAAPGDFDLTLDPAAIEYAVGKYIFRVLRIRSGVVSELEEGSGDNQFGYNNGTHIVTVHTCLVGDKVKCYYPSATAYTTLWTDNDSDPEQLVANAIKIELQVGVGDSKRVYRIQNVSIDIAFDRADYKEIGNREVVQTGVSAITTTVSLGRILEDFTIEEILRGTSAYPYIDTRNLSDEITLRVYIYEDYSMTNFKIGYKINNLSPMTLANAQGVEEYGTMDDTLEADNLAISDVKADIDA